MPYETVPPAPAAGGGGEGGVTDHGALTGLGDNDHPQYANLAAAGLLTHGATSGNGRQLVIAGDDVAVDDTVANVRTVTITSPGGGVTDHGALTGLGDNDHPQYFVQGTDVITDTEHGSRAGGALHANVVAAGAAGFMTGADKTKLDGIGAAPYRASQVLGSAQTSIVFSGLNGDAHRRYRIHGYGPVLSGQLTLTWNALATSRYTYQVIYTSGALYSVVSLLETAAGADIALGFSFLADVRSGQRRGLSGRSWGAASASIHLCVCSAILNDTSANITSLTLTHNIASGFQTGFRTMIEEVQV